MSGGGRKRGAWSEFDYFEENPCLDCGESDPLVLEFDHLGDKLFCISSQFASRNWNAIVEEMEKCDVVCANCHRRRTARRAGFARAVLADRAKANL